MIYWRVLNTSLEQLKLFYHTPKNPVVTGDIE